MAHPRSVLKIVVIDDDPTGSQTVHGCPLLLRWDPATLETALADPSPLLFVLANSRALEPAAARERVGEICAALGPALRQATRSGTIAGWLVVSRGDSTLRSHFPLEVEVIDAALGPFDATLLVPAFLEGGRTTVDGVHLLHGRPVHESPFARDSLLGYRHSFLPDWVEEKSDGRIPAATVERIGLQELERGGPALRQRLERLEGGRFVVVDAREPRHLVALGAVVRELAVAGPGRRPRRFLFQSAASLLNGLVDLPPQPLDPRALGGLRRLGPAGVPLPGLVVVGSHVPLADAQLEMLLAEPGCTGVELEVARVQRLLEGPLPDRLLASLEESWKERVEAVIAAGDTPVLFTSRGEIRCRHAGERRALGQALAGVTARLAAAVAPRLGYLISKGGITTQTLLAEGLQLSVVSLRGQLLPGLSLVLPAGPAAAGPLRGLPLLTFPGNLGDDTTLLQAWRRMEQGASFREGRGRARTAASTLSTGIHPPLSTPP